MDDICFEAAEPVDTHAPSMCSESSESSLCLNPEALFRAQKKCVCVCIRFLSAGRSEKMRE